MTSIRLHVTLASIFLLTIPGIASGTDRIEAINRTNAENFKDRALGACISEAYEGSNAGKDASITTSAFLEWTYYDFENANPAVEALIERFLNRNYSNPVEGYAGAEFKLLKCLDMRHSKELNELTKKYVPHPSWIGDKPARKLNN